MLSAYHGSYAEPGSIQHLDDYPREEPYMVARFREEDIGHMSRSLSMVSQVPSSHESDIDLGERTNVARGGLEVSSQLPGLHSAIQPSSIQPSHQADFYAAPPLSPDKESSQHADSISVESDTHLLG